MEEFLSEEGFEVLTAEDGRRALEHIEARRPGLLLTDLEMPQIDGERLISAVRLIEPDLPILVLTSRLVVDAQREAQRLGVRGYLNKPIDLEVLLSQVMAALRPG